MRVAALIDRARASGFTNAELAASVAELDDDDMEAIADRLLRECDRRDLHLARALARHEMEARRRAKDGCGDTLYELCFLLYLLGDVEDVLVIDEAKHINFDTGCTIDGDFYRMRRSRAEIVAAVAILLADDATRAAHPTLEDGIVNAFAHPNYESIEEFERSLRRYFGVS